MMINRVVPARAGNFRTEVVEFNKFVDESTTVDKNEEEITLLNASDSFRISNFGSDATEF